MKFKTDENLPVDVVELLRPVLQTIPSLLRLTHQAILLLGTERLTGHLWIVEEHQIRIRGGTP